MSEQIDEYWEEQLKAYEEIFNKRGNCEHHT
jgi:hypothetical protein